MPGHGQRALAVFPAGISNGEFGLPADQIVVMDRGEGCRLWDTAGKEYLDFSIGWGSCLPGHAHPKIVEAVTDQVARGSNFAFANDKALEVAEEIVSACPGVEKLRFCASGTEATMYCMRLAKAFSGRRRILKFEGAYHGANEAGVTSLFPQGQEDYPRPELTSAGTPSAEHDILVAPYNDLETASRIIASHAGDLAAVIMEPLQRCTPPVEGFLEGIREACNEHRVLLIFDEVVTGFRLAYGGAQEYYGVIPDLAAYGKAMGGGHPVGAFGGRADIMEWVSEHRIGREDYVWMASTLGGNPVSMAAAGAALEVYRQDDFYGDLHALGKMFRGRLRETLIAAGEQAQIIGRGPLAQVVFTDEKPVNYRGTARGDKAKASAMMLGLFRRGIFLNPMGTKLYLSAAHDLEACNAFCERLYDTLTEMKKANVA